MVYGLGRIEAYDVREPAQTHNVATQRTGANMIADSGVPVV